MIEVAQFYLIKHLKEREGLSNREIARRLQISRNTVSAYLKTGKPPGTLRRKEVYAGRKYSPETERILPLIDAWIEEDRQIWKKQRHTAVRMYHRLVDEYGYTGSEPTIRRLVRERKKHLQEVFIPLQFQLGQHFQFDWGEADVVLSGKQLRVFLFCGQLSASRKRFARAYLHEKQEAFLDGFIHMFDYFGGVPARGLFDNLKTAVIRVLEGRERLEQETFQMLQAHYLFKAEFCNPRKGNEKGQVEGLVGYARRNALVPIPEVQTLDELNEHLIAWCDKSAEKDRVPHDHRTVAEVWAAEKEVLHPLPEKPFEACRMVESEVNKLSVITYDANQYSVPSRYVGQRVWVKGFVDRVIIVAQNQMIAEHTRSYERSRMILQLDHYLEALLRKPRAVSDARVMQSEDMPDALRRLHREMNRRHGSEGDRGFIRFLLLHRELGMALLSNAAEQAEKIGVYRYEGLHDLVMRISGQQPVPAEMPRDSIAVSLDAYRIQKADVARFTELLKGGETL